MFHQDSSHAQPGKLEESQEQSCAEDFIQLYYDKMDKQQYQQIAQLYLPDALLVWNGVSSVGNNAIQQFFSQLPRSTHTVISLDMQRLQDNVAKQKTFLITTGGTVRFEDYGLKTFSQTFCTTLIGDKYKITIDNYRCSDGTPNSNVTTILPLMKLKSWTSNSSQ